MNQYNYSFDLIFGNGNVRFKTVFLKSLSDKKCERYCRYFIYKAFNFNNSSCSRNAQVTLVEKPQTKLTMFKNYEH